MRKTLPYYIISFVSLFIILIFSIVTYQQIKTYASLTSTHNTELDVFQNLHREIKNAAIITPDFDNSAIPTNAKNIFHTDKQQIINDLKLLRSTVIDSLNKRTTVLLEKMVIEEIEWIIKSDVPDSIIANRSQGHIAKLESIDSLISVGISRTNYLIRYRKIQLDQEIVRVEIWMIAFIVLSASVIFYISFRLYEQETKTEGKEKDLDTIENRFQLLLENNYDIILLMDAQLNIFYRSPSASKIIGWTDAEILHMNGTKNIHPDDREMAGNIIKDLMSNPGKAVNTVFRSRHKDGHYLWLEGTVINLLKNKDINAIVFNFRDVTARIEAEEKLASSEVRFRSIIENSSEGITLTDEFSNVIYRSPGSKKITGALPTENVITLTHPDDLEIIRSKHTELISKPGIPIDFQGRLLNALGNYIWLEGTFTNLLHVKGVDAIVTNYRNINERKELEVLLHKANALARIGGWEIDPVKETVYWSDITKEIHETENEYVADLPTMICFYQKGFARDSITQKISEAIQLGTSWDEELQIITAKKHKRWIRTIGETEFKNGKCVKIFGSIQDIDQRKKSDEAIKEGEARYRNVVENMHEALIIEDMEGRLVYANTEFYRMFGYCPDEDRILTLKDYTAPSSYEEVVARHNDRMKGIKVSEKFEYKGLRKDGTEIWIEARVSTVLENDKPVRTQSLERDITERKKAEAEIKTLNEDLEKRIVERTGQLKKSNEEMEAFSYSVSHDLRAPLRGIIAFANILEEEYSSKLDDEARRITSIIRSSTLKMGTLIDDLLAFSRMGKQGISRVHIDMNDMVHEIAKEQEQIYQRQNNITWNIHDLPAILADGNMLRQVWINLISNAVKYSAHTENARVEISSYMEQENVVFWIKDNGAGFDEEYKDKLFKVFQRLHDADDFEGTGVGLALVEKIISRHDGKVWAKGKEGEGACFYISLPQKETYGS